MGNPLAQLMTLLQGNGGWGPDVQRSGVRPDFGLTGAQIGATARSPYERTLRPGEQRSGDELRDMLAEVILAAGSMAVPGVGQKAQAKQAPAAKSRGITSPTVYHGTSQNVEKFNPPKGRGSFFSDNIADAAVFAGSGTFSGEGYGPATPGANITPARVRFTKPVTVDYGGKLFDYKRVDEIVRGAEQSGADGVVIQNIRNFPGAKTSTSYVALKPGRVISAITKKGI